jgi:hypothetical protein
MTASVRPYLRDGRPPAPLPRRNPNPPDWIIIAAVIALLAAMMHAGCGAFSFSAGDGRPPVTQTRR